MCELSEKSNILFHEYVWKNEILPSLKIPVYSIQRIINLYRIGKKCFLAKNQNYFSTTRKMQPKTCDTDGQKNR